MPSRTDRTVYFIAEAGVNHNGDRDVAFALVDTAADAGADAVKFQTFDATALVSGHSAKAPYQQVDRHDVESQRDMLKRLELPRAWHAALQAHAKTRNIEFLSTPFDVDSLDFLAAMGVARLKVPSGELCNAPLIWRFASTGIPLIISTGMASLADVEQALAVVTHARHYRDEPARLEDVRECWRQPAMRAAIADSVTLLHCTSSYPAPASAVNLSAMATLRVAFGLEVGYSDHTEGTAVAIAAAALGARVIEKHFTVDRSLPGPDQQTSITPSELKTLIVDIRRIEQAFGTGIKTSQEVEADVMRVARQRLVAARDIAPGSVLKRDDLTTLRSPKGMEPSMLWELVGQRTLKHLHAGDPVESGTVIP